MESAASTDTENPDLENPDLENSDYDMESSGYNMNLDDSESEDSVDDISTNVSILCEHRLRAIYGVKGLRGQESRV